VRQENDMDAVELTRELVRFDTINPPGQEQQCARHLGRILEGAGFAVREHEFATTRTSLVARIGGRAEKAPLCLTGHIDTVPLGGAPWTRDPFAGETAAGRLYGRGSSDMKSGVAAVVVAAVALAPRLRDTAGLELVITAGEEVGCEGAQYLAARTGALGRAGAIVVAEPTGNLPMIGHKGALWLQIRATGVTAHGSMPERGVNAIYKAARAVSKLEQFSFGVAPHPVLGPPTLNVGTITGGLNVNSVPDAALIGVDIRTIPEQKNRELADRIAEYLGDEVTVSTASINAPGVWTEPDDPWIREVFALTAPLHGGTIPVRAAPYFTDASALNAAYGGPPTVILGPGELEMAHKTDEYCMVERIEQAVGLYTELARRWCGV
jgi:succinyl-diaminopimelate desuccinylase